MAESESLPLNVIRYGVDEPPLERWELRAGSITAVIEGNNLRYIRVGDHEIVRGVYMAVRDRNWDTPPPRFLSYDVQQNEDGFVVRFRAEHVQGDADFIWDGTVSGTKGGVVTYEMDGEVRKTFWRGRIGICLLLPMSLAGVETDVLSGEEWVHGRFPVQISPHQPFTDMREMRYEVGPDIRVDTKFEGDLFEMEDQRNWTDASYKTYCTPLRIPYPVEVKAGDKVWQKVTITVQGAQGATWQPESHPELRVAPREVATLPGIGLGTASHGRELDSSQVEALEWLHLDHLWHEAKLLEDGWEAHLRQAAGEASSLGATLEIAAVTDAQGTNLDRLIQLIAGGEVAVARLMVFDSAKYITTRAVAAKAREVLSAAGLSLPLGGGSLAFFTEYNRADRPLDLLDFAAWALNPQVHAFDNASLVETLEAEAVTVDSGRAISDGLPLRVGPVTLKMSVNPNATAPAAPPLPGELPAEVDPRQMSLFGAAWTVGSLRYLASAGTAGLTYFETTGLRGIMDDGRAERHPKFHAPPGAVYPVYHVFADVGEFAGAGVLEVSTSDPLAANLLALRSGSRLMVLAANMTNEHQQITLALPAVEGATLRVLDEATAAQAMTTPAEFRGRIDRRFESRLERVSLDMAPYAVARLDGTLVV